MFKEISAKEIRDNAVSLIADEWGLVTAGTPDGYNTMTVSWGALGELWGKDMVTIYIRPQRYTKEFLDANDYFTLSFYPESEKKALAYCGAHSGRDVDKAAETGLTPVFAEKAPYFAQAKLVLVCKKMAVGRFDPQGFVEPSVMDNYAAGDFHYIYYGQIEKVLISE